MNKKIKIALAGNPNSGKTTLFNELAGARQHIGNYSGVTVEKIEGNLTYKNYDIDIVDLPGTYSLTTQSIDEVIARNFLIKDKPDLVVNVVDSSNLERHLYLSAQLIELGVPLVFAFNMYDEARRHAIEIDKKRLSELLGGPIVFTIATKKGGGTQGLLDAVIEVVEGKNEFTPIKVSYSEEVEEELTKLEVLLAEDKKIKNLYSLRWFAVKLLEEDKEVVKALGDLSSKGGVLTAQQKSIQHLGCYHAKI